MAQQIQVIDAVGSREHPAHHAGRLRRRVGRVDAQQLIEQPVKTSQLGQPQRRHQTRS